MSIEETKAKKAEIAFQMHTKLVENETQRRKLLAENALILSEMIGRSLYKLYLGDDEATPAAYYSQIEIYYSRNQINRLKAIHRAFSQRFGMDVAQVFDIPESRLSDIVIVGTEENINELLSLAKTMIPKDWKEHIRELKHLPIPETCKEHKYEHFAICRNCGEKTKESQ